MLNQFAKHELRRIARNGKTDALRAHDDGGVDADDFATRRNERAARIAGIERGIGLDHVLDQAPGARAQRAAERRDHAGCHRRFEAERIADRDNELSSMQSFGIAESRRWQMLRRRRAQQRKIGIGIFADQPRANVQTIGGRKTKLAIALHDVAVRQHQPVRRDDDA
jgi:hypothetical protein